MSIAFDGEPIVLGEVTAADLPDFTSDKDELLFEQGLRGEIKRMGRLSLLLDGAQIEQLGDLHLRGEYIDRPEFAYGRDQSAHVVFFGQMILNSVSDYERPELVAIKPFGSDHKTALHELAVNTTVNRANGLVRAFEPLGMWRDEQGDYSLITRYEHAVQSYDRVFWANRDEEPEALAPAVVRKAVRLSSFGLGLMHGLGFAHGDPQVKNLGNDNTRMRFIDLEEARQFPRTPDQPDPDPEQTRRMIDQDWSIFVGSCFMEMANAEDIAEAMLDEYEAVAKSYYKGIRRMRPFMKGDLSDEVLPTRADIIDFLNSEIEKALEGAEQLDPFDE